MIRFRRSGDSTSKRVLDVLEFRWIEREEKLCVISIKVVVQGK